MIRWSKGVIFQLCLFTCIIQATNCQIHSKQNDKAIIPLNIAHRGSCGRLPEHSLPSYQVAIDEGADFIECDMCLTKDLRVICSHESWLSETTNVADVYPESRMNTYLVIDSGQRITDYFSVDFTWEELSILKRRQKVSYRDPNHDDLYPIVTLDELIETAQNASRPVGVYLETKDSTWVNSLDIVNNVSTTFEDVVLEVVQRYGYYDSADNCFIQSFIESSLKYLRPITNLTLVRLMTSVHRDDDEHLMEIAEYADAIGPSRSQIVRTVDDQIVERTDLVERARNLGLPVHVYTLKNEDRHLAWDYGQDPYNEIEDFVNLGVDGIFTDFPETLDNYLNSRFGCSGEESYNH